jgi:L-proline amide hydrolase
MVFFVSSHNINCRQFFWRVVIPGIQCEYRARTEGFSSTRMSLQVKLDDIIGDTTHLECVEKKFEIRGLFVQCWTYYNPKIYPTKTPVIGLHGGPSFCHNYILGLKLLADYGHPVIFYDQCGCGKSSVVPDPVNNAPWLLTLDYYVEELHEVIKQHGLSEYYLFGSSWGTMLAQEFAVLKPQGLRGLILEGVLSDAQIYIQTQWRDRLSTPPTHTQALFRRLVAERDFSNPIYKAIEGMLSKHFTCRQVPVPDCFNDSCAGANETIYKMMQGDCEFLVGGVLEHWSIVDRLHNITVPTLVLVGEYDSMTVECSQLTVDYIATSWPLVEIPRAAHCKFCDEPLECIKHIAKFLVAVESASSFQPLSAAIAQPVR